MRVCIICEDKNIEEARKNSKNIFPAEKTSVKIPESMMPKNTVTHLATPCSSTGQLPTTHWFCFISCDKSTYERIVDNSIYSTIEEASPKEFLERWNLKVIR